MCTSVQSGSRAFLLHTSGSRAYNIAIEHARHTYGYYPCTLYNLHAYFLFQGVVSVVHDVHVHTEGDVLRHDQHVRHRNAGQQQVDGVGPHIL